MTAIVDEVLVTDVIVAGIQRKLVDALTATLTPKVLHVVEVVRRDATETTLRDAASAWDAAGFETHDAPDIALWLRARAAGCTCGVPQACAACGTILCADCEVGDPSRCDHGNGALCVGCDIEACAGCAHELRMATAPFAGVYRS